MNKRYKIAGSAGITITGKWRFAASVYYHELLQLIALCDFPLVKPGDESRSALIQQAPQHNAQTLCDKRYSRARAKIVSKAENRYRALNTVTPTTETEKYAAETGKDPRMIEAGAAKESSVCCATVLAPSWWNTNSGFVHANAGIDQSTCRITATLKPRYCARSLDASAAALRDTLQKNPHQNCRSD